MGGSVRGHICVRRQAKDGTPGAAGKSIRTTVWQAGKTYYAGDTDVDGVYPLDIVSDKAMAIGTSGVNFYMCVKTHTSPATSNLTNTTYWQKLNSLKPVVTYLILSEAIKASYLDVADLAANSAFISRLIASTIFTDQLAANSAFLANLVAKRIRSAIAGKRVLIEGNILSMYDANDDLKLTISGEDLSSVQSSTSCSFVPGSILSRGTQESPNFNHGYSDSGEGTAGSITVSNACQLSCPAVPISASFYCDGIIAGSVTAQLKAYWLIDGVRCGLEGDANNTIDYIQYGATRDLSTTIPTQKIPVGAGTHSVNIGVEINFTGEDYLADGGTFLYSAYCPTSLTVQSVYQVQKTEIASNGFRVMFTSNHYMEAIKTGSADSTVAFSFRAGNYILKVTPSGIKKSSDGGNSWTTL